MCNKDCSLSVWQPHPAPSASQAHSSTLLVCGPWMMCICRCMSCGLILPAGGSSCAKCQAGTFSSAAGEHYPDADANAHVIVWLKWGNSAGASSCDQCQAGTFSSSAGAQNMLRYAPWGYVIWWCDMIIHAALQCTQCTSGTFSSSSGELIVIYIYIYI